MKIKASITGISGYIPEYVLTNFELEKIINTNNE
jgi:3-oxoacyl-[acyl-carrier-protein] synthase-3